MGAGVQKCGRALKTDWNFAHSAQAELRIYSLSHKPQAATSHRKRNPGPETHEAVGSIHSVLMLVASTERVSVIP